MATPNSLFKTMVDPEELKWHVVYVLKLPFFGYDPATTHLREYSRQEVIDAVKQTFHNNVFIADKIDNHVTLLVTPDHWNRRLPRDVLTYNLKLLTIPFSWVLYPQETNYTKMLALQAPPDAAMRIAYEKSMVGSTNDDGPLLAKQSEDYVLRQFRNFYYASSKSMAIRNDGPAVGSAQRSSSTHRANWSAETKDMASTETASLPVRYERRRGPSVGRKPSTERSEEVSSAMSRTSADGGRRPGPKVGRRPSTGRMEASAGDMRVSSSPFSARKGAQVGEHPFQGTKGSGFSSDNPFKGNKKAGFHEGSPFQGTKGKGFDSDNPFSAATKDMDTSSNPFVPRKGAQVSDHPFEGIRGESFRSDNPFQGKKSGFKSGNPFVAEKGGSMKNHPFQSSRKSSARTFEAAVRTMEAEEEDENEEYGEPNADMSAYNKAWADLRARAAGKQSV